jgi:hypothetical protein
MGAFSLVERLRNLENTVRSLRHPRSSWEMALTDSHGLEIDDPCYRRAPLKTSRTLSRTIIVRGTGKDGEVQFGPATEDWDDVARFEVFSDGTLVYSGSVPTGPLRVGKGGIFTFTLRDGYVVEMKVEK